MAHTHTLHSPLFSLRYLKIIRQSSDELHNMHPNRNVPWQYRTSGGHRPGLGGFCHGNSQTIIRATLIRHIFEDAELNIMRRPRFSLFYRPAEVTSTVRLVQQNWARAIGERMWRGRLIRHLEGEMSPELVRQLWHVFPAVIQDGIFRYRNHMQLFAGRMRSTYTDEIVDEIRPLHLQRFIAGVRLVFSGATPRAGCSCSGLGAKFWSKWTNKHWNAPMMTSKLSPSVSALFNCQLIVD